MCPSPRGRWHRHRASNGCRGNTSVQGDKGAAISVEDIDTKVQVEHCVPCNGKVIINALVKKNVTFKTREKSEDDDDTQVIFGTIRHATITTPVHTFVEVPGALSGDQCVIEEAGLEDACSFYEPLDEDEYGHFTTILDKQILRFVVKVVRPTQFTIPVITRPDICPDVDDLLDDEVRPLEYQEDELES
ncbi:MAG: DUF3794 domain-containing protein [Firmicutes bacterium]|nr:DUF3794 domain-containing protein [Bacillota bacterium]